MMAWYWWVVCAWCLLGIVQSWWTVVYCLMCAWTFGPSSAVGLGWMTFPLQIIEMVSAILFSILLWPICSIYLFSYCLRHCKLFSHRD
ncbi:MAG: hypothetical protein AAB389_04070 [Patescibacteria group bacterium]